MKQSLSIQVCPLPSPSSLAEIETVDWKIQAFGKIVPFPKSYPAIFGSDVAGTVYEVGEDVTKFKEGDRVIG